MSNAARNQSITHWNFHKIEVGMKAEWRMGTPRPFWEDWQLLEFGRDPPGTYFFSLLSCQSSKYEDKTELSPKCMKDGTEKETMKDSLMEDSFSEVQKKSVEQFTCYGMSAGLRGGPLGRQACGNKGDVALVLTYLGELNEKVRSQ